MDQTINFSTNHITYQVCNLFFQHAKISQLFHPNDNIQESFYRLEVYSRVF
jgi:hypothetical protein